MTPAEFYAAFLHYSVALRLFEDTCRQLRDCEGTVEERQALVDETLRLAVCVSDRVDEVEDMAPRVLEGLQESGEDDSLAEAIPLIINQAAEDRRRVEAYTKFITSRRIGQFDRLPRRPKVANPFVFIVGDGTEEDDGPVTIRQEDPRGPDGEEEDDVVDDEEEDEVSEDAPEDVPEEGPDDAPDEEDVPDEVPDEEDDAPEEEPGPETAPPEEDDAPEEEPGGNPLARESERIMSERRGSDAALLLDEVERIRMEGERVEIVGKVRDRKPSYRPVRRR